MWFGHIYLWWYHWVLIDLITEVWDTTKENYSIHFHIAKVGSYVLICESLFTCCGIWFQCWSGDYYCKRWTILSLYYVLQIVVRTILKLFIFKTMLYIHIIQAHIYWEINISHTTHCDNKWQIILKFQNILKWFNLLILLQETYLYLILNQYSTYFPHQRNIPNYYCHCITCKWCTCYRHILRRSTVVNSPAIISTICHMKLCTSTPDRFQPNDAITWTKSVL